MLSTPCAVSAHSRRLLRAHFAGSMIVKPHFPGAAAHESTVSSPHSQRIIVRTDSTPLNTPKETEVSNSLEIVAGSEHVDHHHPARSQTRKKRPCSYCRKKRTRCVGQPPACESCNRHGLKCSLPDGQELTWQRDLRQVVLEQKTQLDHLNTLISGLRNDSNDGSTMLLAKLRLGASVEALAGSVRAGSVLDPTTCAPKSWGTENVGANF